MGNICLAKYPATDGAIESQCSPSKRGWTKVDLSEKKPFGKRRVSQGGTELKMTGWDTLND